MNLQLHHVISDITGVTGLAIMEAVLKGERNPKVLAKLRNHRIKASEETIAKSLVGDYRSEHLFTLRQSLTAFRSYQKLIDDCDEEIHRSLEEMDSKGDPPAASSVHEEKEKEAPEKPPFQLSEQLKRILGVDLTKVPSLGTLNVQILLGEIGPDLTNSAVPPHSHRGWACVPLTISAEAQSCGRAPARSTAVRQRCFDWPRRSPFRLPQERSRGGIHRGGPR